MIDDCQVEIIDKSLCILHNDKIDLYVFVKIERDRLCILHKIDLAANVVRFIVYLKTHLKPVLELFALARTFYHDLNKNAVHTKFVHTAQKGETCL